MNDFVILKDFQDVKVHRDGTVISRKGKVLKHNFRKNQQNYPMIKIPGSLVFLHRLLAIAFIPNPNNYPFVNHIDGNKENHNLDNLEWCTQQQNIKHAYSIGLPMGNKKLDKTQVLTIRKCIEDGLKRKYLCKYFNVSKSTIDSIAARQNWKLI